MLFTHPSHRSSFIFHCSCSCPYQACLVQLLKKIQVFFLWYVQPLAANYVLSHCSLNYTLIELSQLLKHYEVFFTHQIISGILVLSRWPSGFYCVQILWQWHLYMSCSCKQMIFPYSLNTIKGTMAQLKHKLFHLC